ncbi:MAG: lamin tail domain-containing protein, partial [Verrucomicrobiota bacterium]
SNPHPLLLDLLVNETFRHGFINTYADYMNTALSTGVMLEQLTAMVNELLPYMPEFQNRWQLNYDWSTHLNAMTNAVAGRVGFERQNVVNKFGLNGTFDLTLDTGGTGAGLIAVNHRFKIDAETPGVSSNVYPWQGVYFHNVPVTLEAVPAPGSVFARWTGAVPDTENPITVSLTEAATMIAVFDPAPPVALTISEVMFNPAEGTNGLDGDRFEFIEIYNPGPSAVDLSGYVFDEGIDFTFPEGVVLASNTYLVVVKDLAAFAGRYETNTIAIAGEYAGDLQGALDNGGERISLRNSAWGYEVASFTYNDGRGWPPAADGAGHSLVPLWPNDELLDYGDNWRASTWRHGSPGGADPPPIVDVVLNEIIAHTDVTNGPPGYDSNDQLELFNTMATNISLADWYLSDDPDDLKKWAIPSTNTVAGMSWILFDE